MKTFFTLLLISLSLSLFSQQAPSTLELKEKIVKEKDLQKKVGLLYELGDSFREKDSALSYYAKARDLAKEEEDLLGEAKYASHAIEFLNESGEFRKGLDLTLEALKLYEKANDPRNLSIALLNVGNQLQYLSDYRGATQYYLKSKHIVDSLGDKTLIRVLSTNLSSIFIEQKDYPKGISYGLRALALGKESGKWENQVSSLYNLSIAYQDLGRDDLALKYTNELEDIGKKYSDTLSLIDAALSKGLIYGKKDINKGISFYQRAESLSRNSAYPQYEMNALAGLGNLYIKSKNYPKALEVIERGKQMALSMEMKYELTEFYQLASLAHEELGQYKEALFERKELELLEKELESEKYKNDILNLESRYRFEQNEAQLAKQRQDLQNKSLLNYIFVIIVVLLVIILYQALRNYRNKQKINLRRIKELETERQLLSTRNLLQGQEGERSRMARELHDGLGGLLSGVKINLSQMKKNITITDQDNEIFERSVTLIDTSIKELRRVAHNLMPESIIKLGLEDAIKEYLSSLQHENMSIIYLPYGIKSGTERQMDISIYRIVQELMNNIIKHAEATQVLVQIRRDEDVISIDVEDNGKGFEYDVKHQLEGGMGLGSIQSRVDLWDGSFEVDSVKGEGTSVHIDLKIRS